MQKETQNQRKEPILLLLLLPTSKFRSWNKSSLTHSSIRHFFIAFLSADAVCRRTPLASFFFCFLWLSFSQVFLRIFPYVVLFWYLPRRCCRSPTHYCSCSRRKCSRQASLRFGIYLFRVLFVPRCSWFDAMLCSHTCSFFLFAI